MKKLFFVLTLALSLCGGVLASATAETLAAKGDVELFYKGAIADIYIDANDFKVVQIAAGDLAADFERVTGKKPAVTHDDAALSRNVVIIGTIGKSALIDKLIADKKINVDGIKGSWETFALAAIDAPVKGVAAAVVIVGSDRRGTAFGVYELSAKIGVSPWYWWADVTPDKQDELIISKDFYSKQGPPSVKYRGIFINDEAFGLNPWASKTFEPEVGNVGPKTYAKVFELLLRLKANYIWPAMKSCTKAFNYYPLNRQVADDYAIVMGSSHCEPMLRDNPDEWPRDGEGPWDYTRNKDKILNYWDMRVRENGRFENIYTLGMRGIEDNEMQGDGTLDEKTRRLEGIINDQRELIRKYVNPDIEKVPQLFSPYKEVLTLYENGLKVPDDVTILWTDDNYGYIRRLPTPEEQKRSGGSGVYYHISYSGRPHDYLWLSTTPPALIWEEMRKAYAFNARRIWVVNVGDIKPAEMGTEYFLQLAWDISTDPGTAFIPKWTHELFGDEYTSEIFHTMEFYYMLNYQRKPEHMGFNEIFWPNTVVRDPEFSLYNYGDEIQQRLDQFEFIYKLSEETYLKMPISKRDAFYELVLYPVRSSYLMNQKILYAFKSRDYAKQGRASANEYAKKSEEAFRQIQKETDYYNNEVAGGKWKYMINYKQHDRLALREIKTGSVEVKDIAALGVAIEGRAKPLPETNVTPDNTVAKLPEFNQFTKKEYFIDIFNKGSKAFDWKAEPSSDWIKISQATGTLKLDERLWVSIDYDKAPKGENIEGSIKITGAGAEYCIGVSLFNPESPKISKGSFIQDNGVVSIDVGETGEIKTGFSIFFIISGLGLSGKTPLLSSWLSNALEDSAVTNKPEFEFPIYIFKPGKAQVILEAVPTHEISKRFKLRCAVSIDDGPAVYIDFAQGNDEDDEVWKRNVLHGAMYGKAELEIDKGKHILKIIEIDPSVILDKIFIDFGGMQKSYLGPPETRIFDENDH
ncbi:MAG: glycosyl hydrolase 115 family protein [bacterium]